MPQEECESCGARLASQQILDVHIERYCPKATKMRADEELQSKAKAARGKSSNNKKAPVAQQVGRLEIPVADPYYMISSVLAEEFGRILALVDLPGAIENVAIIGPKGSGKTSGAKQLAALRKKPYHSQNAYMARSSDEWFGSETISPDRGLEYNPSLFVEALETEGATVVINDLLLMQNKSVQNGLNDLLDPTTRYVWVDALSRVLGRPIRVAPNVLIIATWNAGTSYTGNITLADNIMDRFPNRIMMEYPPQEVQVSILMRKTDVDLGQASRICDYADRLRNLDDPIEVSVRSLLQVAKKISLGAHIRDAMAFTIIASEDKRMQTKMYAALEAIYTVEEKEEISTRKETWEAWDEGGSEMITNPDVSKAKIREEAKKELDDEEWDQAEDGGQFASAGSRRRKARAT